MKFIVYSANLLKKISLLDGIISNNTPLPILNNVLFDLDGDLLKITASDMETTMTLSMEVEGSGEKGKVAVPSRMLSDMMKAFPEQPLTFNFNQETYELNITSEQGNYKMAFFNPEDYPNIPQVDNSKSVNLSSDIILRGIEKTLFSTSNDDLRPVLQGVYMKLDDDGITFVSSDTHRLSKYTANVDGINDSYSFIIPKKPLKQLDKILLESESDVTIEYNDNNVRFSIDNINIVCRLIEGNFPNYEAVIPKDNPNKLFSTKDYLFKAMKRVSIFSDKATNQISFKFSGSTLTLSAEDVDYSNKAIENLTVDYKGDNMTIGFNAKSMIEMLSNINNEDIVIEMSQPNKGAIIKPQDINERDGNLEMLIMPVLVKQ